LENIRTPNYTTVENMFETFKIWGSNMSLKLLFLYSHLGVSPSSFGYVSNEYDDRFHQDTFTMEKC
jgi:hypothetical protein